jgi:hypothetical protein
MKKCTKQLFAIALIMCYVMSASAGKNMLLSVNFDDDTSLFTSADTNLSWVNVQDDNLVPLFCDQVILMDFGRTHNIASLVAATGKDRLIYPEGCATVTADGEEVSVYSVEAYADGFLYIFVEDLLDEDMDVKVTFINPTDEAYRIVYTDGDMSAMPDYDGSAYYNNMVVWPSAPDVTIYFVLFYILDGVVYDIDWFAYGEEVVQKEAPVKEGYTFSGWSGLPETMPGHDVIVTGSFEVDGIKTIVINQLVDVYTLQGVMVKRQIAIEALGDELSPGIYCINGKKVIIQ